MSVLVDAATTGFDHEALFYRSDAEFLDGVVPFLRDGLQLGEAALVAEPRPRIDLLRNALGEDADRVHFLDMAEIGANPARIIGVWACAVEEHTGSGQGLRGVGEPAWHGRRAVELEECQLHEQLLNHAFDDGPAWRLMCPYDEQRMPRTVVHGALAAHPVRSTPADRTPSDHYAYDGHAASFAAPLVVPTEAVLRGSFGADDIPATRRTVAQYARSCGLPDDQVEVLELAASELAANSIRHGGGQGSVAMWLEPGAVVVEFTDAGLVLDPLVGRRTPRPDQDHGHGLYLVNQLCDLVQVRSSPAGTTVRISTWL
jgi:anti-sigma regulatory factor (Ser/Thr protein kinase)